MTDFSGVTERPGDRITQEASRGLYTRYNFATRFVRNRDVLELGCGTGQGLGYLRQHARSVIGGDYTESMLQIAQRHYKNTISLVRLDAESLPFQEQTCDVVILYEAIYYLSNAERFLDECRRVLRPSGVVILCTVNPEWTDFHVSPHGKNYSSLREIRDLFERYSVEGEFYAGFPVGKNSNATTSVVSILKRMASRLGLIPKTMKGKMFLKRIFLGKLVSVSAEVDDNMGPAEPLVAVSPDENVSGYKVLYAVGRLT